MPAAVAGLAGLETVDYRESFGFPAAVQRSPEQWARLILEGAAALARRLALLRLEAEVDLASARPHAGAEPVDVRAAKIAQLFRLLRNFCGLLAAGGGEIVPPRPEANADAVSARRDAAAVLPDVHAASLIDLAGAVLDVLDLLLART